MAPAAMTRVVGWSRWMVGLSVALAAALALMSWVSGVTAVIVMSDVGGEPRESSAPVDRAEIIFPLERIPVDGADWEAFVLLDRVEHLRWRSQLGRNCFRLSGERALKALQQRTRMKRAGGDMATVDSRLVVLRNGRVVYNVGIVFGGFDLTGIQTRAHGWLEPADPGAGVGYLRDFEPVRWPVLLLR